MDSKIKQVLVVRKDLNMRKGKMTAQGAHGSMAAVFPREQANISPNPDGTHTVSFTLTDQQLHWYQTFSVKIVVGVSSEEELLAVHAAAQKAGLPCSLIQDAGLTEFGGVPTYTCVGIGPAPAELIDPITGQLPLM